MKRSYNKGGWHEINFVGCGIEPSVLINHRCGKLWDKSEIKLFLAVVGLKQIV